jgi:transcriptional regulator with XRE-family HTH domain
MDREPPLREAIKQARKKLRWTQENLAQQVGCSRSLIAAIESGTTPTESVLQKLLAAFPEQDRTVLRNTFEAREVLGEAIPESERGSEQYEHDMIGRFISVRWFPEVDLTGQWNAMWLTTVNGKENRNRELVHVRRRWNSTWEFSNESVSEDNPEGGYLWVAKLELFDNKYILGFYCARDRGILPKGTLCLELQTNGREILGVWDGLNFDTMWAHGLVALCRSDGRSSDAGAALDRFIKSRPKMPY